MKNKINTNYMLRTLDTILSIPSPSGYCHNIMQKISSLVDELGYELTYTKKGCGVITIKGQDDYVIGLSAHVDTLGAMVRSINSDGTIRFTSIGGFMMQSVEYEYCTIHTRNSKTYDGTILSVKPSVHVYDEANDLKRSEENMKIVIDEDVKTQDDVKKLGIDVGDFISFDPRISIKKNGYIKSRHLDDKAGVTALLGLMQYISENKITPKHTLKFFISVYEEVGHGSSYIPADIDELIAVDMGAMGNDLQCTEQQVSICAKDSSGPYDYNMTTRLTEIAKDNDIDYVIDIYPHYGSDASAALSAGNNIRCALIGPGVSASHGVERTHVDGLLNTTALLAHYISK